MEEKQIVIPTQELLKRDIWGAQDQFKKMSSDLDFTREALFAWQALTKSEYALNIAVREKESVRFSVLNVAAIGLTLNPAQGMAYLVPRGGKVCLDISYKGLIKLATDTGAIMAVSADIVKANDSFEYRGPFEMPNHRVDYFSERGAILGVYVVAKCPDGSILAAAPIAIAEIERIRDRTEAWKAFASGKVKSCPWATDFEEMAKKTALKRASKLWPKTERLAQAVDIINEHEGIDFKAEQEAVPIVKMDLAKQIEETNVLYDEVVALFKKHTEGLPPMEQADFLEDNLGVINIADLRKATKGFLESCIVDMKKLIEEKQVFETLKKAGENVKS